MYIIKGYRVQLLRPTSTKVPRKQRKCKPTLGTPAGRNPQHPTTVAVAGSRSPRAIGQPELHRQQAFSRTAVDARHLGRDKANAEEPSVGDAPQAPVTVEADSPAPTNAAAEPESAAPLSCLPHNPKLHLHHETKGQRAHLSSLIYFFS